MPKPTRPSAVRRTRHALRVLAALLALILVAGCGASPEPAAPQPAATPAASEPATGTEQPAAASPQAPSEPAGPPVPDPIVFAGQDWDSDAVHRAIARYIIEVGYGHKTDAIPGSTLPLLQGLIRGDIHVNMEVWYDNIKDAWDSAEAEGRVVNLGVNFPDAVQGFWVPTYMIEGDPERGIEPMAPDLRAVTDLPRYWELFRDPEDPRKGRFYDCIAGWACEDVNAYKWDAYNLYENFNRFLPGTGTALATSIATAHRRGEPWVGYYWGPTWILGMYDMTMLAEPPYTEACWDTDKACAYPVVEVSVGVSKEFYDSAPHLVEFLTKYETSQLLTSELLAYMQDNDAEAEEAAQYFLRTYEDLWTQWVPEDVAARIKASL